MKSSRQNRQSKKSGGVKSSRGPPGGKKKGIGAHKPNKPGRKQSNTTRNTLPWLFSQESGAHVSQGHHTGNNNSVFDISDDSLSEDNFEADPGGLKNDLPLSDPISEFSSLHEVSNAGDDRAQKNLIADGNRITETSRERSRSPPSSRGGLSRLAPRSQLCADTEKDLARAEREVGPAAAPNCASSCCGDATLQGSTIKAKPGKYGIISLFDGVSSVVRSLTQKLGCPPTAILLAENDEAVRRLVCAEFGYRTDEKWGYTTSGSACLYITDVHKIADNDCLLLRQLTALFPGLRWFIIGGSPCQDLTYAGYLHVLLGLVGARSRLFFLLLLTIRTMQVLVGCASVRFLVENAGSMKDVHFVAFCKLLGLPYEKPFDQYTWDLAKFTCFITRKRNFFRNMADVEPITDLGSWHSEDSGPLLTISGKTIAFAPLLRTRKTLSYGICHSSWTLYQPQALVWDYSFWGRKDAFRHYCAIHTGHRPALPWEHLVPPPFLDDWKAFIEALERGSCTSANFDNTFRLPFRILTAKEVLRLSGLENHWTMVDVEDANRLPDPLIRDMCGNSFHPSLISSAFGSDEVLKRWIQGEEGGPTTFVADQSRVHALYSELAQLIKQKGLELHKNIDIPVVEELPRYPSVESASGQIPLPSIAQPVLPVKLNIELSKNDQRIEFGIDATVAHVNEDACWTLERASLALYFDAFRAPVTFGFDADTLLRLLWSESQLQKSQSVFREHCPQCPVATDIANFRLSIENWFRLGSHSLFFLSLLQSVAATAKTKWPVGYILLVGSGRSYNVFYLGNPNPKLLILTDYRLPRKPLLTLMGATAYSEPLSIGCAPTILPTTRLLEQHNGDDFLYVECASGQWFLHCGPCHCTSSSCLCCLLSMLGDIRECPWHCSASDSTLHDYTIAHLIGVDGGDGKANVIGYIGSLPLHTHLILIHMVPEAKLAEFHTRIGHLSAPFSIFYHLPSEVLSQSSLESLSSPTPLAIPTLSGKNGWPQDSS